MSKLAPTDAKFFIQLVAQDSRLGPGIASLIVQQEAGVSSITEAAIDTCDRIVAACACAISYVNHPGTKVMPRVLFKLMAIRAQRKFVQ